MFPRSLAPSFCATVFMAASALTFIACAPGSADDDVAEGNSAVVASGDAGSESKEQVYITCEDKEGSLRLELVPGKARSAELSGLAMKPVGVQHQILAKVTGAYFDGALIQYALANTGSSVTTLDENQASTPDSKGILEEMYYQRLDGALTITVASGKNTEELTFSGCKIDAKGDTDLCKSAKCRVIE